MTIHNLDEELEIFTKKFDTSYEDRAATVRAHFLSAYPLSNLKNILIDDYVIGKRNSSFCTYVEAKTKDWANIQGATAIKFGIYFGKTKSDIKQKYRFSKKFGETKNESFRHVKLSLLNLIQSGKSKKFREIDENPLSQMFKAKILSLYFPDIYLNICSSEHIEKIALNLGVEKSRFISEYQHLLLEKKLENKITKDWSNPKFMSFLYAKFIYNDLQSPLPSTIKKPRSKSAQKIDFESILLNRDAIGKASEEFAMEWERNRLIGLGYNRLVEKIKDYRDFPSYGYDYLSFSSSEQKRCIEVKSVGKDRNKNSFRFYLSENELTVSKSKEDGADYYFYLVFYGKDGKPNNLIAKRAKDLYKSSEISPCAYVVRFEIEL